MFQLGKTIVSEDIIENEFVCNLTACKGACCVDGDAGAPLTKEETAILDTIYPKIKHLLREEGKNTIEESNKTWVEGDFQEYETPLVEHKECAYVIFDNDKALCGIEKAHNLGLIPFKKPISCHLYPIRIKEFSQFIAINYDKWHICSPACDLGKELSVPVYQFLKEPLIRKFGIEWYNELEKVASEIKNK